MYINFQQNRANRSASLLDNELPRKENISTDDRRTDGRTDEQTDRRRARQQ